MCVASPAHPGRIPAQLPRQLPREGTPVRPASPLQHQAVLHPRECAVFPAEGSQLLWPTAIAGCSGRRSGTTAPVERTPPPPFVTAVVSLLTAILTCFPQISMDPAAKAAAVLGVRGPGTGFRRRRLDVPPGPPVGDDLAPSSGRPHRRC